MEGANIQQQVPEPIGFPGSQMQGAPNSNSSKSNWKWLVILILFLVVIGGVTFFVFKSSRSSGVSDGTSTPNDSLTNLATPAATATPVASPVDKSTINVSVLNGTGIAGEAGLLSDQLKNLGYANVTTGNADSQNATDTTVTFSSTVSADVVTEITGKLNDMYTNVVTDNSATLPSGVDIQITTGTRKGAVSATTSASPTDTPVDTSAPAGQ